MTICQRIKLLLILLACHCNGCALLDNGPANKPTSTGLIATPASYYSTNKARYLGTKYKNNLDRLAGRIARNSTTAELQFANNISSVGGIGFFTHSATKTADERYLEVVLATPETFETKGEYSEKVNRLFSRYGQELLGMLAGDTQIYQDKELSGYGLNLTWRNAVAEPSSNRVTLARAIIYFQKDRVSKFLQRQLSQQDLLSDAVIFAMEEDGPLNLVSYQPRESTADFRPAIREDNLTAGTSQVISSSLPSRQVAKAPQQNEPKKKPAKSVSQESTARGATNAPVPIAERPEVEGPPAALHKDPVQASRPANSAAEQIALTERPANTSSLAAVPEVKSKPTVAPQLTSTPAVEPSLEAQQSEGQIIEAVKAVKTEASAKAASDAPVVQPRKGARKTEPTKETEKMARPVLASNPSPEVKTKTIEKIKKQESIPAPAPIAPLPASGSTVEEVTTAPVPAVEGLENRQPAIDRAAAPLMPALQQSENETKTDASATTSEPQPSNTREAAHPRADLVAPAAAKVGFLHETKRPDPAAAPLPAAKTAMAVIIPEPAKPIEVKRTEATSGRAAAEKLRDTAAAAKIEPPARELARVPSQVELPTAPAVRTTAPEPVVLRRIEPLKSEIATRSEVKSEAVPAARLTTGKTPEVVPARKVETPTPAAVAKVEPQTTKPGSMPPVTATFPENAVGKNAPEQLALLRKPPEPAIEKKSLTRQAPRSLEGFIIQIAFNDKEKAQGWAEKMAQRGYAVSVTEAGAEGALRVRLGNFAVRDEAERQLRNFKQEGMSGIIINLPLAFRPEARVSVP